MIFETNKDKCEFYRSLADLKLMPNGYVLMMLDGRSFSKLIKNNYKKPFDEKFINMMNETAKYLCQNIQGAKFAFVQSDEISIVFKDNPETDPFMQLRMCKLLSIAASMAAGKFNQLVFSNLFDNANTEDDLRNAVEIMKKSKLAEFDCKVWSVPTANDAMSWFVYRQMDCIRNSKQQTAQTWLSHNKLMNHSADEQISMLKEFNGEDWDNYPDGQKYGRFIRKTEKEVQIPEEWQQKIGSTTCLRSIWEESSFSLTDEDKRAELFELIKD